jgi:hypothetical protein
VRPSQADVEELRKALSVNDVVANFRVVALCTDWLACQAVVEAAQEAEDILKELAKSTPVRRTEGRGVWTFEDDFICAAHANLASALAALAVLAEKEEQ